MSRALPLLLLAACSEYELARDPVGPGLGDDTGAVDPTGDDGPGDPPPDQPVLECTDDYNATLPWRKSPLWTDAAAPVDGAGTSWSDPAFDDAAWTPLAGLPDTDWTSENHDVFYRATFWLDAVAGQTSITFVGNDGVWLFVNGAEVGHWGSAWREGGCINVTDGSCGINYEAPPADVTPFLREGTNTIAVMLTNGPTGYYLDIDAACVQ